MNGAFRPYGFSISGRTRLSKKARMLLTLNKLLLLYFHIIMFNQTIKKVHVFIYIYIIYLLVVSTILRTCNRENDNTELLVVQSYDTLAHG